jgi:hypothetical protein
MLFKLNILNVNPKGEDQLLVHHFDRFLNVFIVFFEIFSIFRDKYMIKTFENRQSE